jgi:hypothetical protein
MARVVAQYFANLGQTLFEGVVRDRRVTPDMGDQFIFGYQPLALLEEIDEDLKSLWAQVAFFAVTLQAKPRPVNFNAVEAIKSLALRVHDPFDWLSAKFSAISGFSQDFSEAFVG